MLAAVTPLLVLFAAAPIYVHANPDPNNPAPGDVFIEGQSCKIGWDADPTGVWKSMDISLMTGDNFNMISLTTVATVDGTDPDVTTFSFPCPRVTPHSPIYFYQFSSSASTDKTWTGRFTITDSAENIVPPVNSTQSNGDKIPWGTGTLVDAPSTSPSSSLSSMSPPATSASVGSVGTPAKGMSSASSSSSSPTGRGSTPTSALGTSASSTFVVVTTAASATPSTPSSTQANSVATLSVSSVVSQAGLALVLAAFGFAVAF